MAALDEDCTVTLAEPRTWPAETPPAQEYCEEDKRLSVVGSYGLDALDGDPELARIARFAALLCGTSSGTVSIVEAERQRFLTHEPGQPTETPRSTSFCAHAMLEHDMLEVLDAATDDRFADFALVKGEAHVRYYVGAPLISSEGAPIGALCVTDTEPRSAQLNATQREGMRVLAAAVKRRLEAHRQSDLADKKLQASADRLQSMLDSVPDIAWSAAPGPVFDFFNARFAKVTGLAPPSNVEDWRKVIHPEDFDASWEKFGAALKNPTLFEDEWRLLQADGSYRWVVSRAVPSSDNPQTARWFGTLTDIDDRYRISQERELLAGELAHRIKNIFSVITGLVSLRARDKPEHREFGNELTDNIRSLARAQEFALPLDRKRGDDLIELLQVLMAPYGTGSSESVRISGDAVCFGRRAATPLALVFHELATNSAKYGALSIADGVVDIGVTKTDEDVIVTWDERDGPATKAPTGKGFGSRLIAMSIEHQLGGSMTQDWQADGLSVTISLPLGRLSE